MSKVFVIDAKKQALNPIHPGRARILLSTGKAAVFKRFPFTIVLKCEVEAPKLEPLRVKDVPHRYCRPIHRNDGYSYQKGARHSSAA